DIEAPLWEFGGELVEAGAARHRGGNGADRAVTLRFREQSLGKDAGVARRPGGALGLLAGDDVELLHAVVLVGAVLGRRVAFALLSYDMDQARPLSRIADVFENRHKLFEVVTVDRADVVEAELREQRAAHRHAASEFVGLAGSTVQRIGKLAGEPPGKLTQAKELARGDEASEIAGQPPDRRGD